MQGQVQQQTLSYDQDPTPGTVADGQIPAEQYLVAEQADASVTVTAPEENLILAFMEVESTLEIEQQYDWMDRAVNGYCERLKSEEWVDCGM